MNTYRKTIELDHGTDYWFVAMGPIPGNPDWHMKMYASQSYPFPSLESATRFAVANKAGNPQREIRINYPDGTQEFVETVSDRQHRW